MKNLLVEQIGGRKICLKGVGKFFYQDGLPISISVSELKKKGIEVSILHVADECLKNGWNAKTTFNKLKADFEDLSRTYFPETDLNQLDEVSKLKIIKEIETDFEAGYYGILDLPLEARFGVYTAFVYYKKLLSIQTLSTFHYNKNWLIN